MRIIKKKNEIMKKVIVSLLALFLPYLLFNADARNRRKNAKDCPVKYYIGTTANYPIEGFVDSIRGELAKYMDYVMTDYDHYDPRSIYYDSVHRVKFLANGSPLKMDTLRVFVNKLLFDFESEPEYLGLMYQARMGFRDCWNIESDSDKELQAITKGKDYYSLSTQQRKKILQAGLVDFVSPEDIIFYIFHEDPIRRSDPEAFVYEEIFP